MQFLPQYKDKWRISFAVCITFGFYKKKFIRISTLISCYTEFRVEFLAQKGLKASSSILVFQRNVAFFKFTEDFTVFFLLVIFSHLPALPKLYS